jgi:hypothetical protein
VGDVYVDEDYMVINFQAPPPNQHMRAR